ncbi:cation:dicarboxylase symporter family transporter [Aestuariirhabdus sp. Z084]|uniref:cation:dicarboxylate symporter family transporter n=1 Tax=Aestuariirhabdus haliotis TaxID=2918751 RepID=UPI00201B4197|nr:cation:dicarboxylase symporter family transporter [Aestuariirhabdus haliotis]MCL6415573.1 cation:dicarboxylase symporter family transporter [Aestuariirhabdus haliotis]MCL6419222.1 cation:dicarboxylase symporter family transporter [Aestuariirhabdus haliotis]
MSLASKVILGLIIGVSCGLFWGELTAPLEIIGDIFLMLLQMTVLPYILTSVMLGVGSLKRHEILPIAKYGGLALLLMWSTAAILLLQTAWSLPHRVTASFFSLSWIHPPQESLALSHFIPANPFLALSERSVPAIVLFSVAMGITIIGMQRKEKILEGLTTARDMISSLSSLVIRFTPFGVFAISAAASGTMELEQLKGIYVFVTLLSVMSLFLTFWAFPHLIRNITPFRYREIIATSRDALVTAFATGNLFVVLPILSRRSRVLLLKHRPANKSSVSIVDVIVPISYSLPTAGKMLGFLFILFAGWFSGKELSPADFPVLLLMGLTSFFSPMIVSIPEMLNHFNINPEIFKLYLLTDQILFNRFAALTGAMFILGVALIVGAGATRMLKVKWRRISFAFAITVAWTTAIVLSLHAVFAGIDYHYNGYQLFIERGAMEPPVKHSLLESVPNTIVKAPLVTSKPVLKRIRERGFLRVGYYRDWLPYAFHNVDGELVGYDIEIFNKLAADLGVEIEFVRIYRNETAPLLNNGYLDIASGVVSSPKHLLQYTLSSEYGRELMSLIVPDNKRRQYRRWEDMRQQEKLIIGVPDGFVDAVDLSDLLPNATLWEIASPRTFFRDSEEMAQYDALLFVATAASGWGMINPEYSIAIPQPEQLFVPLAFPLARSDLEFERYVRKWLELRKLDGTLDRYFDYWIKGELGTPKAPRWSLWQSLTAPDTQAAQ